MKIVYVIDDDALMRETLGRSLKKVGLSVRLFASGKEALATMGRAVNTPAGERPGLVISDIQMPGLDGIDVAEILRGWDPALPIILITGHVTETVRERANAVGVKYLLRKPTRDFEVLVDLARREFRPAQPEGTFGLDQLELGFLTGLSHELRTPLTAIKLALDGLFAEQAVALAPRQRKLVGISQRNVDRIIDLVENQLDLLQIILGNVSVARQLVPLRDAVAGALRASPLGTPVNDEDWMSGDAGDIHLFTDPKRLHSVLQYIFKNSEPEGAVDVRIETNSDASSVSVEVRGTRIPPPCAVMGSGDDVSEACLAEGVPDFGYRACQRLVECLGGTLSIGNEGVTEYVRLQLPAVPAYDRRQDFIVPMKHIRRAAMLSGKSVSFFRCEVSNITGNVPHDGSLERCFLQRCASTLSAGDAIIRGRTRGTYYLALLERRPDEIDHILRFLTMTSDADNRLEEGSAPGQHPIAPSSTVDATLLQTLLPGQTDPDDLLKDIESVL